MNLLYKSLLLHFRIHELQAEVTELQEKLEISERGAKNYSKQVYLQIYYYLAVVAIAMTLIIICSTIILTCLCRAISSAFEDSSNDKILAHCFC